MFNFHRWLDCKRNGQWHPRKGGGHYRALCPAVARDEDRTRARIRAGKGRGLSPTSRCFRHGLIVGASIWLALSLGYCAVQSVASPAYGHEPPGIGASAAPPEPAGTFYTLWGWQGAHWRSIAAYRALTRCQRHGAIATLLNGHPAFPSIGSTATVCAPLGWIPNAYGPDTPVPNPWPRMEASA